MAGNKPLIVWTERTIDVADLKPFERNPRRISDEAYEKLKRSVSEMGIHQRVLATPDLRIIGGHQRKRVFQELGIERVPVLVPDRDLTEAEFRKLIVTDNLPFGSFDFDMLANEYTVAELTDYGMPASWLPDYTADSFTPASAEGLADPNAPVAVKGDIWKLGQHRLICGDRGDMRDADAIIRGWQGDTRKKAIRQSDGLTFDEASRKRPKKASPAKNKPKKAE